MASLMLVYDFWNDYLLTAPRLVGFTVIAIGIALAVASKKITRVYRKQSQVANDDKLYIGILTLSLIAILAGMIISIF